MKRTAMVLTALLLVLLTACGGSSSMPPSSAGGGASSHTSSIVADSGAPEAGNALVNARIGLGIVATTDESTAPTGEKAGQFQANVAICALALGEDNTILSVRFDTVQAKVGFDLAGMFTGDVTTPIQTKRELGDSYGMKAASGIGKEWYEQINALEQWMVGKTVTDAVNMKVTERDAAHTHVPAEEELKTSVTISVTDQLRALEKAYANVK
ncbi:MAG: hypothetical protein RR320_01095 [Oscillospiraceae bacterium]